MEGEPGSYSTGTWDHRDCPIDIITILHLHKLSIKSKGIIKIFLLMVYLQFPIAIIINYYKLGSFKQHKLILLTVLEVRSLKSRYWLYSFWWLQERIYFLSLSSFQRPHVFLGFWPPSSIFKVHHVKLWLVPQSYLLSLSLICLPPSYKDPCD